METHTEKAYNEPATGVAGYVNQQETIEKIGDRFKPLAEKRDPTGTLNQLSLTAANFAREIVGNLPGSRERSLAITHLEECFNWVQQAMLVPSVIASNR